MKDPQYMVSMIEPPTVNLPPIQVDVIHDNSNACTQVIFFLNYREVQKSIHTSQNLHDRWSELISNPKSVTKEELEWTTSELRNSLRSIEWDLEDLEETVDILL